MISKLEYDGVLSLLNFDETVIEDNLKIEIKEAIYKFYDACHYTFYEKECYVAETIFNQNIQFEEIAECEKLIVGVCTIGWEIDSIINSELENGNFLIAMVYDYLANYHLAEENHKRLEKIRTNLLSEGKYLTIEVTPGTNADIEYQKEVFRLIGDVEIKLQPSLLMRPQKSLSYFYGITQLENFNKTGHDCSKCKAKFCPMRKNSLTLTIRTAHSVEDINVSRGTILLNVINDCKYHIDSPCYGKKTCKKCSIRVLNGNANISKEDSERFTEAQLKSGFRLACCLKIENNLEIFLEEKVEDNIRAQIDITFNDGFFKTETFLAYDIGTTTLALALIENGKIIDIVTKNNSGAKFGADVIARLAYVKEGGLKTLHKLLKDDTNELIIKLLKQNNIEKRPVLVVSGNCTMLHFFTNKDCGALASFPYTPSFKDSLNIIGSDIGIANVETIITLPSISAFVGADIVSGLSILPKPREGMYNLFLDLGTNAELALFNAEKNYVAASAAGPAFEGACMDNGMSARNGAIESLFIKDNKNVVITTIGNGKAQGICGTGYIDGIAELLKIEKIDENGVLDNDFEVADGVFITARDVAQFQLAKAAISSGVEILIKKANINNYDLIEKVYISGGFASKINIKNLIRCKVLDKALEDKIITVGNSSLCGAIKFNLNRCKEEVEKSEYIDLAQDLDFNNIYINNLMF